MKVLVVTSGYAPDVGGLEAHVTHLARGLGARGVDVHVVTQRRETWVDLEEPANVGVTRLPVTLGTRALPVSPQLWRWVARNGHRFDLVHAHQYQALPALAAATVGRPRAFVFTPHYHGEAATSGRQLLHRAYRPLGGVIVRRADRVICVSSAEAGLLQGHLPAGRGKITVLPNGISTARFRDAEPWPDLPPTILCVGRLERYKGFGTVVRALRDLPDDVHVAIVGAGPDRERLEALARSAGVTDRVRMLGHIPDHELERWYASAAAFVSLSEHEAFGITVLEAAVCGVPSVVSDIPVHREVLAGLGTAARYVPLGIPPAALARSLAALLAEPRAERERVEAMSWDAVVDRTLAVYREVLAARAAR